MRILLLLGVAGVAVSGWLAPRLYRERPPTIPRAHLEIPDARDRIELGERVKGLGVAFQGYEELYRKDPSDVDALKGLVRTGLMLGAAAIGQPELEGLVSSTLQDYLERREEIDPDGAFLRDVARQWLDVRREHSFWLAKAAVAIYESPRRGPDAVLAFTAKGPFYRHYFPYVLQIHPAWVGVEPMIRHYLDAGDLEGRVQAGVTLLAYHNLYGVGGDLLDRYRVVIRRAFLEAKAALDPDDEGDEQFGACLFGLAMLGGAEEKRLIADMRLLDLPRLAHAIRVARVWAGIDPPTRYGPGSKEWEFLDGVAQRLIYRAAVYRYAKLHREVRERGSDAPGALQSELADLRSFVESGLPSRNELIALECFRALALLEPANREALVGEMAERAGALRLVAAFYRPSEERLETLVRFLAASDFGLAALAAVSLVDPDGPMPLQVPAR